MSKQTKSAEKAWEIKDRVYYLLNGVAPITFTMSSRHSSRYPLLWFDEEKGYSRELRYATNQKSPFVDEQMGHVTLAHIVFENGVLHVPKTNQSLQKLLSIYHPQLNSIYAEYDAIQEAEDDVEDIMNEFEAMKIANELDVNQAEAVLRVEQGSSVSKMSSLEIKRDIMIFAKKNPKLFVDLVNDENIQLRNLAIKAVELGVIKLDEDQRTFKWAANGKKLMTVPFEENPYSAMAAFFKTDEGMEVYKSIEKKVNL
jgi:hypothetical protein